MTKPATPEPRLAELRAAADLESGHAILAVTSAVAPPSPTPGFVSSFPRQSEQDAVDDAVAETVEAGISLPFGFPMIHGERPTRQPA